MSVSSQAATAQSSADRKAIYASGETPPHQPAVLYILALGCFAIGTDGFMIAAILPAVARSLQVSVQAAGQLVTVFALVYALSSPLLTAVTSHWPRRRVLMLSLAVFSVANFLAAATPSYMWLLGARVLLAMAAGLFVPNANAAASSLVPVAQRGRALAIVSGGMTLSVAVGVPMGALIGAHFGWRATFVGVALLSNVALAVLAIRLPQDLHVPPLASLGARLAVIATPGVLPTLATTTLWATAAYTVYTYISPFLIASTGVSAAQVGFVLTLLGVFAVGGVVMGGDANDRFGARRVHGVGLPVLAIAFAGLTLTAHFWSPHALAVELPLIAVWGLSAWSFFPPQQARLIGVAGAAHTPVALSLNASFMYLGFSLGAAIGSVVISLLSVNWIGAAGAGFLVCGMVMSRFAWSRTQRPS
jgi:predicted MFS family arabinose efflux permease